MTNTIQHVATFWLKDPDNADHLQELVDGAMELANVPGVTAVYAGPRANTDWPVPDYDVDAAMVISFEDLEAVGVYVPHPLHLTMIDTVERLTKRVHAYYINA
ncbi:Dabb family protein [Rhodococcus sp. NPDC057529]|uniref:Dabb family protein n=1 Tax=Rhodococcus sp. NPDC057529 TaxID=3346158 RepID=UPI00366C4C9B